MRAVYSALAVRVVGSAVIWVMRRALTSGMRSVRSYNSSSQSTLSQSSSAVYSLPSLRRSWSCAPARRAAAWTVRRFPALTAKITQQQATRPSRTTAAAAAKSTTRRLLGLLGGLGWRGWTKLMGRPRASARAKSSPAAPAKPPRARPARRGRRPRRTGRTREAGSRSCRRGVRAAPPRPRRCRARADGRTAGLPGVYGQVAANLAGQPRPHGHRAR